MDIFKGTFSRKYYWLVSILFHIIVGTILTLTRKCSDWAVTINPDGCNIVFVDNIYFFQIVLFSSMLVFLVMSVRRLNEMGANKLWLLGLLFFPYSFFVSIWLMVAKPKGD